MDLPTYHSHIKSSLASGPFFLRVKVIAGSAKTEMVEVLGEEEPILKIRVAAPREKGKANKALLKFLKTTFGGEGRIISGVSESVKLVELQR